MNKAIIALTFVVVSLTTALFSAQSLLPSSTGNVVIAEKPEHAIGGQAALLVPDDLSADQHKVLNAAYDQAKRDGHKNPELVQGILLQESKAGAGTYKVAGPRGNEYFGLGQIKLGAAREVMNRWPELWKKYGFQTKTDDELKANLILNSAFNIELTSKYLKLLQTTYGFAGRQLLNAYNRGPGGVETVDNAEFHYALGVEQNMAKLKVK